MASGKTQKNHYISQFILRGFSSNKEKSKVWRCELATGDIREESIANIGFIRKGWTQEIESYMNEEYESDTKFIVDKILNRLKVYINSGKVRLEDKVSKSDYNKILQFLSMQFIRSYISSIEIDKNMITHGIGSREGRSLVMDKEFLKQMTHDIVFNELLKRQLYIFGVTGKKQTLLTSDFPFFLPSHNFNLANKDTQWWFPINEKILIVVGGERKTIKNYIIYRIIHFHANEIRGINIGLVTNASRYIFSSSDKMLYKYYSLWKKYKHNRVFDGLPKYLD